MCIPHPELAAEGIIHWLVLIDVAEPATPARTPNVEHISPTTATPSSPINSATTSLPSNAPSPTSRCTANNNKAHPRRHPRRRRTLEDRLEAQIRVLDDRISSARRSSVYLQKELALWKGKADDLQKNLSFRTSH
ncbi:hypothetical protein CYLTODRAFT_495177 [Cylindrobasidium torrendii FP15055 ss-10]|uniref:Uncharacterized protein n=1 Tax=Cylindrobasidium torrendii FP15055 ss-10 TaxID=1314674 RepID=A0A0D7AUB6_9AGAR|nr:hypothetical protein CYLTODRAFT_495177 [Cylindrobasidium torrendii FP15055 ss-10]